MKFSKKNISMMDVARSQSICFQNSFRELHYWRRLSDLAIIVCRWTGPDCVVDVTQAKFSLRARNRRVFSADGVRKPRSRWWVWIESPVTETGECVVASVSTHEHGSRRRGGTGWAKNSFARGRAGYVPSAAAAELSGRGGVTRTGAVPE